MTLKCRTQMTINPDLSSATRCCERWRPGRRGVAFLITLALMAIAAPAWADDHRTPYVPASADTVLQHVPASSDPRVRQFDQARADVRRHPKDMPRALKLADAYIGYGRSTGDARYLGRAQAVIDPWMQQKPVPVPVLLTHATILQSRHFFSESRTELKSILARDPGNVQAWLTLATVAMVQGDYPAANDSCVHLANVGGDFYGQLCSAQLRALTGHAQQAWVLLSLIEHPGPKAPVGVKAYVEGLLADTAKHLGNNDEAEAHFKAALQLTPGDNFLLADYGDFLLDRGRPREVIALLKDYTESDTSFLRLVYAEAALGSPHMQRDIDDMQARFAAMDRRGSHVYRREEAGFELHLRHDPAGALKLAEQNWTVQRAPEDMRIYLEAALAAGQPQAAKPVLDLLVDSHLQDPPVNRLVEQIAATRTPDDGDVASRAQAHR
ncbi:MAG TPA: tetratricopeptide repeat protein [Rhodanobacter sp.]|nr:tetratricopeptide repeat protein [Rhodanobacter sp.]